ncbi:LysR substrate-binding domain-containing protein [Microbispora rosea]|uniref:LysR substrate-binding domain-containing protein n=1 Tax=Microbispora rosea TaxID=58117 RepID=UPI0004C3CEC8|nr:LysR substrate-binding domain-containing protein [Microbispora rosea]
MTTSGQILKHRKDYDGTSPFPGAAEQVPAGRAQIGLTTIIVVLPFVALMLGLWLAWGRGVAPTDLVLAGALYVVTGFGVTVGFHRLLTHGSFTARPWLASLAEELLLLGEEAQTPESNQFVRELCRSAGFEPTVYKGTVESNHAAEDLVLQHRCVLCVPSSARTSNRSGTVWRPLIEPNHHYPWSLLWRSGDPSPYVNAVIDTARQVARRLDWLGTARSLSLDPQAGV